MTELRVLRGDGRGPTVMLLHGLGATADVWDGVARALDGLSWIAPDLPGHGGSGHLEGYTFEAVAAAVAPLVDPAGTVVVGHSFGGVIGLHLAGVPGVRAVAGIGIKVAWTPEELSRAAKLADRSAAVFGTREEAVRRHLRVAGLDGPAAPDAAVRPVPGGWGLSFDQRAFGVGEPGVAGLLAAAPVPVVLARGEHDRMVSSEDLGALVDAFVVLPGLGHNAHVENPEALVNHLPPLRVLLQ
ncbi:alpha/beta fold hydrolase [Dactylosporangium sucinum]|uniref:Alpha/beta hydrolase n=1 Tax=Dactylosporangium sucinum TaxID=1424081 RepID=A0A917U9Y0_9ACTN|nr:alpha/beta fold hydrolase [Dactylosporangium sucinum]GGM69127.1 alpha/beta hydrolase [Dactylosporangium sucinum]